jgi:hypothetical protein
MNKLHDLLPWIDHRREVRSRTIDHRREVRSRTIDRLAGAAVVGLFLVYLNI